MTADVGQVVRLEQRQPKASELVPKLLGALLASGKSKGGERPPAAGMLDRISIVAEDCGEPKFKTCFAIISRLSKAGRPCDAAAVWSAGRGARLFSDDDRDWLEALEARNTVSGASFYEVAEGLWRLVRAGAIAAELEAQARALRTGQFNRTEVPRQLRAIGDQFERTFHGNERVDRDVMDLLQEADDRDAGRLPETSIVPTRLQIVDELLGGGWQPSLNVVLGLPKQGKSALMAACIVAQAEAGGTPGLFSLDDPIRWLTMRLFASAAGISLQAMRRKRTPEEREAMERVAERVHRIAGRVLFFDWSKATAPEIVERARNWIRAEGCTCAYLDTLSEVQHGRRDNWRDQRNVQIGESVGDFRRLAADSGVPFVLNVHTIRKETEREIEAPPQLTDAAESSFIEKRARLIAGVWRKTIPLEDGTTEQRLRVTLRAANEVGGAGRTVELEEFKGAAMVAPDGGRFVDLAKERAALKRLDGEAKMVDSAEQSVRRAKLVAELKEKAGLLKPKKPEPAQAPQLELIPAPVAPEKP